MNRVWQRVVVGVIAALCVFALTASLWSFGWPTHGHH